MKTVDVKLSTPLVDPVGDRTIESVTIREATVKDLRLADEAARKRGDVELGRQLLSQCTGISPVALDRLSFADFSALSKALSKINGVADAEAGKEAEGF